MIFAFGKCVVDLGARGNRGARDFCEGTGDEDVEASAPLIERAGLLAAVNGICDHTEVDDANPDADLKTLPWEVRVSMEAGLGGDG